ncbi:MAG TPA: zinc ribbon domain-containing protein [Chloroflexota bacterium]|nr:zinc ribbon domain-containing protein [Chloroflexota bacterium]
MRVMPFVVICPTCGAANPPGATVCAACGRQIVFGDGHMDDPLANTVGGAPVPQAPRDPGAGLREAGDRLEPLLREAAGVLSDRLGRHSALPPAARRLQTRLDRLSRRPPPYVPPPMPVVPPLPLRAVWFVVAGIALSLLWVIVAWLALISVFGRSVSARMLDHTPDVLTLQMGDWQPSTWMTYPALSPSPYPTPMRAIYFLLVGWWASLVWLILGYLAGLTVIGAPLARRMFTAAPTVAYLADSSGS